VNLVSGPSNRLSGDWVLRRLHERVVDGLALRASQLLGDAGQLSHLSAPVFQLRTRALVHLVQVGGGDDIFFLVVVRDLVNPLFEGQLEGCDHLDVLSGSLVAGCGLSFEVFRNFVEFNIAGQTLECFSELNRKFIKHVLEFLPLLFFAETPLISL